MIFAVLYFFYFIFQYHSKVIFMFFLILFLFKFYRVYLTITMRYKNGFSQMQYNKVLTVLIN